VGVIAIISFQILKSSVQGADRDFQIKPVEVAISKAAESGPAAVIYMIALATLYKFNNKWIAVLLVAFGAVAGQFIFVD
jgi:hypothetical protein